MARPFLSVREWFFILLAASVSFVWSFERGELAYQLGKFGGSVIGVTLLYLLGRWAFRRGRRV